MQFKSGNKAKSYYISFTGHPAVLGKMSDDISKLGIIHEVKATLLKNYIKVAIKIKFAVDAPKLREFLRNYNLD